MGGELDSSQILLRCNVQENCSSCSANVQSNNTVKTTRPKAAPKNTRQHQTTKQHPTTRQEPTTKRHETTKQHRVY